MKQSFKPTYKQKVAIKAAGLDISEWLVYRDMGDLLILRFRKSKKIKIITKGAK